MKMYSQKLFALLWALCLTLSMWAQAPVPVKTTYPYATQGGTTLSLDRYQAAVAQGTLHPCLIFVFGGGFSTGTRDNATYLPFFNYLASQGIEVVSIDYRLGMKEGVKGNNPAGAASQLITSVNMAVEDLCRATGYVLQHAAEWGVDTAQVITCGSSAGAVTVLQTLNALCNGQEVAALLPAGFHYAGVISFAGAIFSTKGGPQWAQKPSPILLYHGESDSNVPYDKLELGNYGVYGSRSIAAQLKEMEVPYTFYSVKNEDHSLATSPMNDNREEIMAFIRHTVQGKEKKSVAVEVIPYGKAEQKTHFTVEDYIQKNYMR